MESLIVYSLFKNIINRTFSAYEENIIQFRLPAKTYPVRVVFNLLEKIDSYVSINSRNSIHSDIKIAKQAFEYWNNKENDAEKAIINQCLQKHPDWIDTKGNLTSYRNEINLKDKGIKTLLLLVGDDVIDDQASLEHLLDCGELALWESVLNKNFKDWISRVCQENDLNESEKEKENCNKLLLTIQRYSDLATIDEFLTSLEIEDENLSYHIGQNLDYFGLQRLDATDQKNVDKCQTAISKSKNYRDGSFALDNTKTAIKKIDSLIKKVKEDDGSFNDKKIKFLKNTNHYESFESAEEYLKTCKKIVDGIASDEEMNKFIVSDSATFVFDILGYKEKKAPRDTVKVLSGMPYTAVLHALWLSIGDYVYSFDNKKEISSIERITLTAIEFNHNFAVENDEDTQNNEAVIKELVIPYLGGIDELITNTIENIKDANNIFESTIIDSNICPSTVSGKKFTGSTPYKATKVPALTFSIAIKPSDDDDIIEKKYKIVFKKGCAISYSSQLVKNELGRINKESGINYYYLPVYSLGKYGEFFNKTDSESDEFFYELINDTENGIKAKNLLLDSQDVGNELNLEFRNLYNTYVNFVNSIIEDGLYTSVMGKEAADFRKNYQKILSILSQGDSISNYATIRIRMLKAFWIIDKSKTSQEELSNRSFSSGCLSILHPAMVEMLNAQISYISNYVSEYVKEALQDLEKNSITENMWQRIEDFSTVQSPIPCVLDGSNIRTHSKGSDLLFKVGVLGADYSDNLPLSVTFDSESEMDLDEISDADLTRTTDESHLICNLICDYIDSYAFASDGMKIAIFMPVNIQAIMSSIISLIKNKIYKAPKSGEKIYPKYPFKLEIEFYSDPEDEGRIGLWIAKFNEYFAQKSLTDTDFAHIDLTIGYRMIRTGSDDMLKITNNISKDFQADISILYESHDAAIWKNDKNEDLQTVLIKIPTIDQNSIVRKFPMIEKLYPKRPISSEMENSATRTKLVSNRQFMIYEAYLSLVYSVANNIESDNFTAVITEQFDFSKWLALLDWCLFNSERVIAIGGEIDKDLILNANFGKSNKYTASVDIVGFGSGVGANANLNYIVASRLFNKEVSKNKLLQVFKSKFPAINGNDCKLIVDQLYEDSKKMADLSLIRTLSCYNYYANDYLGYSMIRHMLRPEKNDNLFCDVVLSLDSYKHWFNHNKMNRADLLWVVASVVKKNVEGKDINVFNLDLTIVESKMATDVEKYFDKAYRQILSTLEMLEEKFNPAENNRQQDARYWWMQLHRIVSSNTYIKHDSYNEIILEALENLAEGNFFVNWNSYIFAFEESSAMANNQTEKRNVFSAGERFVEAILMSSKGVKEEISKPYPYSFKNFVSSLPKGDDHIVSMAKEVFEKKCREDLEEKQKILNGEDKLEALKTIIDDTDDELEEIDESFDYSEDDYGSTNLFRVEDSYVTQEDVEEPEIIEESSLVQEKEYDMDDSNKDSVIDNKSDTLDVIDPKDLGIPSICGSDPNKIFLGTVRRRNEPVYWDISAKSSLTNRHILVLGSSGTGKSYAIKAIMGELSRKKSPTLILDYTNGFDETGISGIEKFIASQNYVKKGDRLPIDPFKLNESNLDTTYDVATRVAEEFGRIYQDIGNNQKSLLTDVIDKGIQNNKNQYSLDLLLEDLNDEVDNASNASKRNSYFTLATKIKPICKINPFRKPDPLHSCWNDIFFNDKTTRQITIFQLKGISGDIQQVIVDFALWDLWNYIVSLGSDQEKLHTVVLDEIQTLNIGNKETPVFKYMTEGRKFGFGVIAASQSLTGLGGQRSIGLDALMNAGTILIFKPKPNEMGEFARLLTDSDSSRSKDDWIEILTSLQKGECIYMTNGGSLGGYKSKVIKIASFEERGLNQ